MTLLVGTPSRCGQLLLGSVLATSACSLALELDEKIPCSSDAQCLYNAGQGSCEDGFCRPPSGASGETDTGETTDGTTTLSTTDTPTTTEPTSLTAPATSETDTTTTSDTDTSTTEVPAECSLNSECAMDERCGPTGVCLDLLSAECNEVLWPDDRDNVVFLGSIMPTSEPFGTLVQPLENAVQLAVRDFNDETALQADRAVAWVRCDDSAGATAAVDAAQHLVDNVGVPAIVGPVFSENVLAVAEDVTTAAGVFVITPTGSAMSIATLDDDDLVWRTIPGDVYQSHALVDRMIDLDDATPIDKLLVLAKDDAYGNGILNAILGDLQAALGMANVDFALYPNPTEFDTTPELQAAYGEVLAGVDPPYSHIIFVGTSEIQVLLYSYLGYVWEPGVDPMPLFTVTHGAVPELERFINDIGVIPGTEPLEPAKPLLETRLQGTSPIVLNPANFAAFSLRYQIAFSDEEPLTSAALSYDAALSTIFAMCTVGPDDEVTGAAIAAAMPRLVDAGGEDISFSGADISFIRDARNALVVDGGSVDLQGVSGNLQWDLETGDVREGVWGWDICDSTVDGSDPSALFTRIYTLDAAPAATGTWSVLMPCP